MDKELDDFIEILLQILQEISDMKPSIGDKTKGKCKSMWEKTKEFGRKVENFIEAATGNTDEKSQSPPHQPVASKVTNINIGGNPTNINVTVVQEGSEGEKEKEKDIINRRYDLRKRKKMQEDLKEEIEEKKQKK